jgi:hypothetical protein
MFALIAKPLSSFPSPTHFRAHHPSRVAGPESIISADRIVRATSGAERSKVDAAHIDFGPGRGDISGTFGSTRALLRTFLWYF